MSPSEYRPLLAAPKPGEGGSTVYRSPRHSPEHVEWATAGALRAYFRSGWAFLIPYLAAYLLYAWLRWPVNPTSGGEGIVKVISESADALPFSVLRSLSSVFRPPCLLHVYWFLHALHLLLGGFALRSWWQDSAHHLPRRSLGEDGSPEPLSDNRPPSVSDRLWPVVPWILLTLIFWIPGVYWEFPGDVWEHYTRINDYRFSEEIRIVGTWRKSSYFLAYSFVGHFSASRQLVWLDLYYAGMCLLLCWQYFQLAREIGLKHNAALLFVFLQTLMLGNSSFSFYRYYGLASTLSAQIGAVAFVCLVLRTIKATSLVSMVPGILQTAGGGLLLMLLMAFNHPQSLGFALLGLSAIIFWRTGRRILLWCGGIAALASLAMVLCWPIDPVLSNTYRSAGWISPWYSFNLLSLGSPAGQRGMQILGLFGVVNLAAGALLLRRNHLVGWLTMTPFLVLLCPLFVIPFATFLSRTSLEYIVVFSRILLGIPVGLALVVCFQELAPTHIYPIRRIDWRLGYAPLPVVLFTLAVFLTIPAGLPFHNRCWQALARPPADLTLQPVIQDFSRPELIRFMNTGAPHFVTTDALGFTAHATGLRRVTFNDRLIHFPRLQAPAASADERHRYLTGPLAHNTLIYIPSPLGLYSPCSMAGLLSGHWNAQEVALGYVAGAETTALPLRLREKSTFGSRGNFYYIGQ